MPPWGGVRGMRRWNRRYAGMPFLMLLLLLLSRLPAMIVEAAHWPAVKRTIATFLPPAMLRMRRPPAVILRRTS